MKTLFALALIFTGTICAMASPGYDAGIYRLDPQHTKAEFRVQHFGLSEVSGYFKNVSGFLDLGKEFKNSHFEATIYVDSVETGVAPRDKHLMAPEFFDQKKYPTMTFKSTRVEFKEGNKFFEAWGDLTIKDVTKRVKFTGEYKGRVADPWKNDRVGFSAKATINRQDFHLTYNEIIDRTSAVSDEIKIVLEVEAVKAKQ